MMRERLVEPGPLGAFFLFTFFKYFLTFFTYLLFGSDVIKSADSISVWCL